ncbi:dUTP diphosphatase [Heliobacterium chlorum]|uniref:Deoxyuridine 5'-triphosphate nucleotidohydrolase n=1 Tax=Heliobacterium chlorum TaxID=2698 RepID=A0ABR7T5G3_HELCL|nr:dUTP diphosphatase [Heliobacterium chlorum]MBC9785896.1 dUTP diphosphatase [Heliobacterium chlorum]
MKIAVKKLHPDAIIPEQQTSHASGFDLHMLDALISSNQPYGRIEAIQLYPGQRMLIRTGIAVQLPRGIEAQVRPRSGLALKKGITVLNSPGTIDADYTGDIGVIVINHSNDDVEISKGDRIAQLVFQPIFHNITLTEVDELQPTKRGDNGFGHTGIEGSKAIA